MPSLSIKKAIEKRRERKQNEYRQMLAESTGIYFSTALSAQKEGFPFLKYAVNALILFTAVFGSIDCFITAFELELNVVPLVITCIIASTALSFMYFSNKAKIATYLLILAGTIMVSGRYYSAINSGMNSIVNNCLKYIDKAVSLPYLREYRVYYEDEYVAMSLTVCVAAMVLLIILNIFISEKMNLMAMFFITFPAVQAGMYFDFDSSRFAMLCVVTSWVLVAGVRFTNSYNGLTRQMIAKSSVKKHKHSYGFVTDSKNVAGIAVVWLSFILIVTGAVFAVVPTENFEINLPTNAIKASTERSVKNFLSYGISSMFSSDRMSASPGQLANLSQISFDGKTDLKVSLVDYRESRIYLRSYVGYNYNSRKLSWENNATEEQKESFGRMYNYSARILESDYNSEQLIAKSRHKMIVDLVDSSLMSDPINIPYYTVLEGDNYKYVSPGAVAYENVAESKAPVEYWFYTLDSDISGLDVTSDADNELRQDAYENALYVPAGNIEAIRKFCEAYNISAEDEDPVSEVVAALESDYEYTLRPGKIPYGEDYVNYFLLGSQKGYCQHFATAATLIFRYLGIPARYAEGYAIDRSDFYDAKILYDEDYTQWVESPFMTDKIVSQIEVSDDKGHAWVEIYKDGIGWVAVEATTAAPSEERNLLASLFRASNPLSSATRNIAESVRNIDRELTKRRLIALAIILAAASSAYYTIHTALIVFKRHKGFRTSNAKTNLSNRYNQLYNIWKLIYEPDAPEKSYSTFIRLLSAKEWLEEDPDKICANLEKELFSKEIDVEAISTLTITLKACRKNAVKQMSVKQKLNYYFKTILW